MGIYNNVGMIKDNYSSSNLEPINYMKENIQKGDTIVFTKVGVGSVAAIHLEENQVYFYNEENWGVEEAYKAFKPNYETVITKEFLEVEPNRIWVVDEAWGNAVENIFDNTDYQKISEEEFYTEYHDYAYKITLVEK